MEPQQRLGSARLAVFLIFIFAAVLYAAFRILERTVQFLNSIPNLSGARQLGPLFFATSGFVFVLAILLISMCSSSSRIVAQRGRFGMWLLGVVVALGWLPFPISFIAELSGYLGSAFMAALLLRIPFDARREAWLLRTISLRAALAATAALMFALIGLMLAKRIAMTTRLD